jgi:hypothetical protein
MKVINESGAFYLFENDLRIEMILSLTRLPSREWDFIVPD